mmetsp:Transcript_89459/g.239809  ORF Transcript_89459/g.239809 Transcript_89459/m.239809 type:complete len:209 (-) Transcript_89459:373-999(-)
MLVGGGTRVHFHRGRGSCTGGAQVGQATGVGRMPPKTEAHGGLGEVLGVAQDFEGHEVVALREVDVGHKTLDRIAPRGERRRLQRRPRSQQEHPRHRRRRHRLQLLHLPGQSTLVPRGMHREPHTPGRHRAGLHAQLLGQAQRRGGGVRPPRAEAAGPLAALPALAGADVRAHCHGHLPGGQPLVPVGLLAGASVPQGVGVPHGALRR